MIKLWLFEKYEAFLFHYIGPMWRKIGQALLRSGLKMQGDMVSDDQVVASLRCF